MHPLVDHLIEAAVQSGHRRNDDFNGAAGRVGLADTERTARDTLRRRLRVVPLLITSAVIAVAVVLGRAMWDYSWKGDGRATAQCAPMS